MPFRSALSNNDEVRFIRSWMAKPLVTGAVVPSGRPLARAMAKFVDPNVPGQVIELGPGTGAVTAALVERGIEPSRMVLVEFNPTFCRLLRTRYPEATILQGDA
jgi:phosphatidylethanolamine/phosphatidyl-N-methylethanolamine N-methyltransferase